MDFVISGIQRVVLYETKSRFYLVGSNNTQTKFRVLNIHRTEPKELIVIDDKIEYTNAEIQDLLVMVEHGNKTKPGQKGLPGLIRTVSAFGIIGFVRFLEGYYIILITKRRRVALIGFHTVYKVEETSMYYIPNDTVRLQHPDEARYVKIFQNVDLSSNFYFSYSYDLTHTLQYNLTMPPAAPNNGDDGDREVISTKEDAATILGVRTRPCSKYVWNWHLLRDVAEQLHADWLLHVIHGYVEQSVLSIYGRPVHLALVARRSNRYAGTRFLKRGATAEGDVANEVETEQIVADAAVGLTWRAHMTSFVQSRGSIPCFWAQDVTKMVPKPPIALERADPFSEAAARHFNAALMRSGSPILVFNLIKKREKKRHESLLSTHLVDAIRYLNQFLPPPHRIIHIGFDMARANKSEDANVLSRLADIANELVRRTGIFHSRRGFHAHRLRQDPCWRALRAAHPEEDDANGLRQTGIIRVNCVDCLDRTNTAQFAIGKVALAFQLYALGVLDAPALCFDSDCVRMLEELYENHGDTLALQYGGSQLVHRIRTYRKTAPWTSQSRDIVHTLSRYYSNTFSDADKQNAINLFLGVFRPVAGLSPIWELPTDYHLHHSSCTSNDDKTEDFSGRSLTRWWDAGTIRYLPVPYEQETKWSSVGALETIRLPVSDERIDSYFEYYRPYELTVLSELFAYTMSHSVKDFMPNFTTDFSPFTVRVRPGKRREELGAGVSTTGPSLSGRASTSSSASSSGDSDDGDSSSDGELPDAVDVNGCNDDADGDGSQLPPRSSFTFEQALPGMREIYGEEIQSPGQQDFVLYRRFAQMGRGLSPPPPAVDGEAGRRLADPRGIQMMNCSSLSLDSSLSVTPPTVGRKSKDVYSVYLRRGEEGAGRVSNHSLLTYQHYVSLKS